MVSGVGFQNTANEEKGKGRHKKTVASGLIIAAVLLGLVIIVWAGLKMQNKSLNNKLALLEENTRNVNTKISTALSEEASDSALRAYAMEKNLYTQYESNEILNEIENIMILKNADGNRVVLKSFQYNAGAHTKRTFKDGSATTTSAGTVTITADADTFDVMAQQIEAFKTSSYFEGVEVGTTDRDDSGRIVFTLTMNVVGYDKSPYESTDAIEINNIQDAAVTDNDNVESSEVVVDSVIVGDDVDEIVSIPNESSEVVADMDGQDDGVDTQVTQ